MVRLLSMLLPKHALADDRTSCPGTKQCENIGSLREIGASGRGPPGKISQSRMAGDYCIAIVRSRASAEGAVLCPEGNPADVGPAGMRESRRRDVPQRRIARP